MKEKVRFRMYTVSQCGYYKRGEQTPEFGSLDDIFRQIQEWITGKSIKQSGTYEFREDDKIYPTFCHSILSNDFGDYLVTTWNQVPSGEKFLASIAGNDLVGKAQVDLAEVPHGNIPGYPTYFWVIPSENKLITLQFSKGINGIRNLRTCLKSFRKAYRV